MITLNFDQLSGGAVGLIPGLIIALISFLNFRHTAAAKKMDAVDADQQRALDDRDELIRLINKQLVEPLSRQLEATRAQLKTAEQRLDLLEKTHRDAIGFIYQIWEVIRAHGLEALVPADDEPTGVHLPRKHKPAPPI